MKKISLIFCFCMIVTLLVSCENVPDYTDEIKEAYRQANHGQVIGGLMWSAVSNGKIEWQDAAPYCRNLDELGHSDWRLPTVDELRILIRNHHDTETDGPCGLTEECVEPWTSNNDINSDSCDKEYCNHHQYCYEKYSYSKLDDTDILWSSTSCGSTSAALWIDFCTGDIVIAAKSYKQHVRCVRKAD